MRGETAYLDQVDLVPAPGRVFSRLRHAVANRGGDLLVAGSAALVQVGGTALAAQAQPLLAYAAGFAATLGYVLLGYPGGPIWISLIIGFASTLVRGYRGVAYLPLVVGYVGFVWLAPLVHQSRDGQAGCP